MNADLFANAVRFPRKALQQWTQAFLPGKTASQVLDAWNFKVIRDQRDECVMGLVRISSGATHEVLKQSGQSGVFVEPLKWDKSLGLPDTFPRWLPLNKEETKEALLDRALKEKPSWGLIRGRRQLGVREVVTKDTVVSHTWVLQTPRGWTNDQVMQVIQSQASSLKDPEVLRRQTRGNEAHWYFKATSSPDLDFFPVSVEMTDSAGKTECKEFWMRKLAAPKQPRFAKDIPQKSMRSFLRGDKLEESAVPVNTEKDSEGDVSMDQANKRRAVQVRKTPKGYELSVVPGDGACLFSSIALGLKQCRNLDLDCRRVRAECITHMRKHSDLYEPQWDKTCSKGNSLPNFAAYCDHMEKNERWGGYLEASAAARHWNVGIVIVPQQADVPSLGLHLGVAKKTIALWYTGKHYDFLNPIAPSAPEALRACQMDNVSNVSSALRGGSDVGAVFSADFQQSQTSCVRTVLSRREPSDSVRTYVTRPLKRLRCKSSVSHFPSCTMASASDFEQPANMDELSDPDMCVVPDLRESVPQIPSCLDEGTWSCPLCPFQVSQKLNGDHFRARQQFVKARLQHIHTFHASERRKLRLAEFYHIVAGDSVGNAAIAWKCVHCNHVLTQVDAGKMSSHVRREATWQHYQFAHPEISRKDWAREQHAQANKGRRMERRVEALNASISQCGSDLAFDRSDVDHEPVPFMVPVWIACRQRCP